MVELTEEFKKLAKALTLPAIKPNKRIRRKP
nr:MAG TPA: hypothetical protein [Bacteriophage sp.]